MSRIVKRRTFTVRRALDYLLMTYGRHSALIDHARFGPGLLVLVTEDVSPELDGGRIPSMTTRRLTVFQDDKLMTSIIIDSRGTDDA
jgi:hypothetical protein